MSAVTVGGGPGLDVAAVLQETFAIVIRNFKIWAPAVLLLSGLPRLVMDVLDLGAHHNPFLGLLSFGALLVSLVAGPILTGALIHSASRDLDGEPEPFSTSLGAGVNNWLILLGQALITGVCIVLGSLLLLVPGIIIALAWCVAAPAIVLEGRGVGASLERSAELTRNRRWSILGFALVLGIGVGIIESILMSLGGGLSDRGHSPLLALVIVPAITMANALLAAASATALFQRLRSLREGVAPEALSEVFG
jgi:hypothetical protein